MSVRRLALITLAFSVAACSNDTEPSSTQSRTQTAGFTSTTLLPASVPTPKAKAKPLRSTLGAEVKVVGLMVNAPTRAEFNGDPRLAFMGSLSNTRVALEVFLPSGGIIDMDRDASVLEGFTDDRGTNIIEEVDFGGSYEMMPTIAEDGRSIVVVAAGNTLPTEGSSLLELEGTLSLTTASTPKVHVATGVELTPDTSFSVGPFHFKVTETGTSDWSDDWSFTIETDDDLAPVISWTITDAAGNEYEANSFMTMTFNSTTQQALQTTEVSGPVTVTIEAWDDARQIEVPFAVTCGLGLR